MYWYLIIDMKKKIYTFITVICFAIVILLGAYLAYHIYSDAMSRSEYDAYRENITSAPVTGTTESVGSRTGQPIAEQPADNGQDEGTDAGEEAPSRWPEPPSVDWASMDGINAWIEVPAVGISYPVVQGKSNDYYLHRTPGGEYRFAGSIFIDSENSPDFTDLNTIIYGHNMNDGSMFGRLKQLNEQQVYDTYPYIWVCTRKKVMLYQIVSVHKAQTRGETFSLFDNTVRNTAFPEWLEKEIAKSDITAKRPETDKGRVLTLSTCKSGDTRQVVQGILVCEMAAG